ncbi:MAG: hypothetical protein AAFV69_00390 [Pseudomonadota bacterium]
MWLVKHSNPVPTASSPKLDPADAAALRSIYGGRGTQKDIDRAIDFLHSVRRRGYWIACDCRAEEGEYPLLSPAYLTTGGTYYLRRLTGKPRANHASTCIFIFDRPIQTDESKPRNYETPSIAPSGYFNAITPEPASDVSAKSFSDGRNGAGKARPAPRLARLLWRLMVLAKCDRWGPIRDSAQPTIQGAFAALRASAEQVDVAPGTALARVIGFHPQDFHSNRLFARIRAAKREWEKDAPPQGFLCLYTPQIVGQRLCFNNEPDIEVIGELAKPTIGDVSACAPYLTLIVVGEAGGREGLAPLRAYAQPIYSPTQFLPVDSGFERTVIKAVNSARWSLARRAPQLDVSLKKPVFDIVTPDGPCRPDIILDLTDNETGEVRTIIVEAMGRLDDPDYVNAKQITHQRMAHIGQVIEVAPEELQRPKQLSQKLIDAFMDA